MLMTNPGIPTTKNTILQDIILVSCVTRMAPIPTETKGPKACCMPKFKPLRFGVDSIAIVAILAGNIAPKPIPINPRAKNICKKLQVNPENHDMIEKKIVPGMRIIFRPTRSESPPKNQIAKAEVMARMEASPPA